MSDNEGGLFGQMQDVKLLLIMQLLKDGVKQSQIAKTLGISDATLSRMLPKGIGRELAKGKKTEEQDD